MSNALKAGDNVVEAHTSASEDRPEVVSFTLKNVRYDQGAAKVEHVVSQKGEVVLRNDTSTSKSVSSILTQSITEQKSWNSGWPLNDGTRVIIQAGHPMPVGAGVQISPVGTFESMHQGRITETYTASYTITSESQVAAHSEQLAAWQLMMHRIEVPYSAILTINYGSNSIETPVTGFYVGLGAPELKISYQPAVALPPHLPFPRMPGKNIPAGR